MFALGPLRPLRGSRAPSCDFALQSSSLRSSGDLTQSSSLRSSGDLTASPQVHLALRQPDACRRGRMTRDHDLSAFGPRQAAATRKLPSQYTKVAFVSRASDADRRSRRRGDAARRSLLPKRQRGVRGLLTRPSSNGVDASAKAALAARQMRRVSWSRVSANFFPHAMGFVI